LRGKSSAVLLVLPPLDHLLVGREIAQSRVLSAMQIDDRAVREDAARMALGPSCVSPAPQLKRDWSSSPEFGWIPANLCDLSKG
jgi:hypothetical protein